MDNKKVPKSSKNYYCKFCDYNTFRLSQYNRHLTTAKHKKNENGKINDKNDNIKKFENNFTCEKCNKNYLHASGLSRHKKNCILIESKEKIDENIVETNYNLNNQLILSNESILKILHDNKELKDVIIQQQNQLLKQQEQIGELIPKVGNNNNTQNNKFNINVFLNEKCKYAINMTDFIKSIEVSLQQLDFTKQNGLVNGISKTIMDNMNKLSVYERPLHCTDIKRETLYIKDENEWSKDNSKEKIKKAIKKASSKNYNALQDWKEINPDFLENDLKQEYFTKTISTIGKTDEVIEEKIIKNLCKETYIKD